MEFAFRPTIGEPPRWLGPFTPAKGVHTGVRVRDGWIGAWYEDADLRSFWWFADTPGARALVEYVVRWHRGGRVLLLPDGKVIKPLNDDDETGIRVVIGKFDGPVILFRHDGTPVDLSRRGSLSPGARWPGPASIGVDCALAPDGSLTCEWYHPDSLGRLRQRHRVWPPDPDLAIGFRKCRPGETSGRVTVTPNGLVVTNREYDDGSLVAHYVGRIDVTQWPRLSSWIKRRAA